MKVRRNVLAAVGVCMLCALCLVALATPAYAYTDPNAVGLASHAECVQAEGHLWRVVHSSCNTQHAIPVEVVDRGGG